MFRMIGFLFVGQPSLRATVECCGLADAGHLVEVFR